MNVPETAPEWVLVGRIAGVHGVRGWVKVFSYTDPRDALFNYQPLWLGEQRRQLEVRDSRRQGKGLVAQLAGVDDRDQAARLIDENIYIQRQQLPDNPPGQYYWSDLIGLSVVNRQDVHLGRVSHLLETGSNDVLVVDGERERLVPFIPGQSVTRVDLENGVIHVDWDPEF
ncbi:MAG: ribosome maturation factor RimM [Wenzhouxiangellaceae bacterium]